MKHDIPAMLETLAKREAEIPKEERQQAVETATFLTELWDKLEEEGKNNIVAILDQLSPHPDTYNGLVLNSLLYTLTDNPLYLKRLPALFSNYDPDLREGAGTYMSISRYLFSADPSNMKTLEHVFTRDLLRDLFLKQIEKIELLYSAVIGEDRTPFGQTNRVVILTGQFLHPPHAPTVDALNYAVNLIRDYGKEVLIISSGQISYGVDSAIAPAYVASRADNLVGVKSIQYEGYTIPFLMCDEGRFTENAVVQGLATIEAYRPEMILCISSPGLLAEPFHDRSFCFIYPTGNALAITKNCHFHTYAEPDAERRQLMEKENIADKFRFAQPYDLKLKPPSDSLQREEFDIPEDAFVFSVIGMRLHTEVDDAFLKMLEKLVEHPKTHIMFAGYFNDYEDKLAPYDKLQGRNTWIGFQTDIMAVHNMTNVFLNPNRAGGGTGVVYALQAELPVLSLKIGDGGLVAAAFPTLDSYDHMADVALEMIDSPEKVAEYSAISKTEAPKFSGRNKLIKRIMEEFDKFVDGKLASQ